MRIGRKRFYTHIDVFYKVLRTFGLRDEKLGEKDTDPFPLGYGEIYKGDKKVGEYEELTLEVVVFKIDDDELARKIRSYLLDIAEQYLRSLPRFEL